MSFLDSLSKGIVKKPLFMILYGPQGVGKTTFASKADGVVFIETESGSNNLDVTRGKKMATFKEIRDAINDLRKDRHNFKTLVIDSLTNAEALLHQAICELDKVKTIDLAQGGYGKGYTLANTWWGEMIKDLIALRDEREMNIICIGHSIIKAFNCPMLLQPYDRYIMQMNEKAAALWMREVDFVGFTNYEIFLKIGQTEKKNKAMGDADRILYTQRQPGFEAKNRLGLPSEMPLDFDVFKKAIDNSTPETAEDVLTEIQDLKLRLTDEEKLKKTDEYIAKAQGHLPTLNKLRSRLIEMTIGA